MADSQSITASEVVQEKVCTKCARRLSVDGFSRSRRSSDGRRTQCKECCSEYEREWRKKNAERQKQYFKQYADNNREKRREISLRWQRNNRDKVRASNKKWRDVNPEKVKEKNLRWERNNKDKRQAITRRYRALKRGTSVGDVPMLSEQLDRQGGMCANCRVKGAGMKFHLDHVVPVSKGGPHTADNVEALCERCNLKKADKSPERWAAENWRLV